MALQPGAGRGRRQFTVDDYHRMVESGILTEDDRVELLDGEIVEMTPIGSAHASHTRRLASLLRSLEPEDAQLAVQDPIHLDEYSEPEPDLALLEVRDDFYRDAHPTPDAVHLVVEVADTTADFDRDVKVPLYAEAEIPVVWVVDLERQTVEVYTEPSEGDYTAVRELKAGDSLAVPVEGEHPVEVDEIWL